MDTQAKRKISRDCVIYCKLLMPWPGVGIDRLQKGIKYKYKWKYIEERAEELE